MLFLFLFFCFGGIMLTVVTDAVEDMLFYDRIFCGVAIFIF